ncbi:MAG: DUF192 domain-containing protein [Phycisphaerales bacterium]
MAVFRVIIILLVLGVAGMLIGTSSQCATDDPLIGDPAIRSAEDDAASPNPDADQQPPRTTVSDPVADAIAGAGDDRPSSTSGDSSGDSSGSSSGSSADPAAELPGRDSSPEDATDVAGPAGSTPTALVVIAGELFELELSIDPATRERGLMGRTSIPERGGMLFIFPEWGIKQQSFWMKNCLVDMDIIYVARDGTVDSFFTMRAPPARDPEMSDWEYENFIVDHYSWPSIGEAEVVIELQAGMNERLGIQIGDRIAIDPALKRRAR